MAARAPVSGCFTAHFQSHRIPPTKMALDKYICNRYIQRGYLNGMATKSMNPEELLPLTPAVFHVLLVLADGERHGYAIMREVAEGTDGRIKMGPGTLYGTIKRLLEAGWLEESDERPDPALDDERRRYYRLTGVGQRIVRAEARRYAAVAALARGKKLLGGVARAVSIPTA
jgi:DNA-binding PadR family transcriptional regulator